MKPNNISLSILSISIGLLTTSFSIWQPDFRTAQANAKTENHLILLNFSGSDWCGPCIRMHKEIFDNPSFLQMADSCLELVNADFPRNKKNQLNKQKISENEALAEKYNPEGKFPFTLLLNKDGKPLKIWEGNPGESVEAFTKEIKTYWEKYK